MITPVEFKDVWCATPDGAPIFERVSVRFNAGERVLIRGPLASGKGLVIKLITALEVPAKGSVQVLGFDTAASDMETLSSVRKRMGVVTQDAVLVSNLKVLENVSLPLLYHTERSYDECLEAGVELLGMVEYRGGLWDLPAGLPLHKRKGVALARALALEPDIIICENLSTSLTEDEKKRYSGILDDFQKEDPLRLVIHTSNTDADVELFSPDRLFRIRDRGLIEEEIPSI